MSLGSLPRDILAPILDLLDGHEIVKLAWTGSKPLSGNVASCATNWVISLQGRHAFPFSLYSILGLRSLKVELDAFHLRVGLIQAGRSLVPSVALNSLVSISFRFGGSFTILQDTSLMDAAPNLRTLTCRDGRTDFTLSLIKNAPPTLTKLELTGAGQTLPLDIEIESFLAILPPKIESLTLDTVGLINSDPATRNAPIGWPETLTYLLLDRDVPVRVILNLPPNIEYFEAFLESLEQEYETSIGSFPQSLKSFICYDSGSPMVRIRLDAPMPPNLENWHYALDIPDAEALKNLAPSLKNLMEFPNILEEFQEERLDLLLPNMERAIIHTGDFDDDEPFRLPTGLKFVQLHDEVSEHHIAALPATLKRLTAELSSTELLPQLPRSLETLTLVFKPEFIDQLEEWRLLPPLTSLSLSLSAMSWASYFGALPATLTDLSIDLDDDSYHHPEWPEMEDIDDEEENIAETLLTEDIVIEDLSRPKAISDPNLGKFLPSGLVNLHFSGTATKGTWVHWISQLGHIQGLKTLDISLSGSWGSIPLAPAIPLLPRTLTSLSMLLNSFEQDFPVDTLSKLPPQLRLLNLTVAGPASPVTPKELPIWTDLHFQALPPTLEFLFIEDRTAKSVALQRITSNIFTIIPPYIQRLKLGRLCEGRLKNDYNAYFALEKWL